MCSGGLKSCCCCLSLRSGSIIAGSLLLAVNVLNVASVVLHNFAIDIPQEACFNKEIRVKKSICDEMRKGVRTAMLVSVVLDCMHALSCLLLLVGIFVRSEVLMLPFLSMTVLQAMRMIILIIISIMIYFTLKLSMIVMVNSSVIHVVVVIYLGVVVYSYYPKIMKSMFRDWYIEMKKNMPPPSNIVEYPRVPIAWIDTESEQPSRSESMLTLEITKYEERAKIGKDILCIVVPMAIVGAAWWAKEFVVAKYF